MRGTPARNTGSFRGLNKSWKSLSTKMLLRSRILVLHGRSQSPAYRSRHGVGAGGRRGRTRCGRSGRRWIRCRRTAATTTTAADAGSENDQDDQAEKTPPFPSPCWKTQQENTSQRRAAARGKPAYSLDRRSGSRRVDGQRGCGVSIHRDRRRIQAAGQSAGRSASQPDRRIEAIDRAEVQHRGAGCPCSDGHHWSLRNHGKVGQRIVQRQAGLGTLIYRIPGICNHDRVVSLRQRSSGVVENNRSPSRWQSMTRDWICPA